MSHEHSHPHEHGHSHDHHDHDDPAENLRKISILLPHLKKHNEEHARELKTWIDRIRATGREDVVGELQEIADLSDRIVGHFAKAIEKLGDDKDHNQ